jgi:serine/threonine protein kinase
MGTCISVRRELEENRFFKSYITRSSTRSSHADNFDFNDLSFDARYSCEDILLGAGIDSSVLVGIDMVRNEQVAMKVIGWEVEDTNKRGKVLNLNSKEELIKRFHREVKILSKLSHHKIVRIIDAKRDSDKGTIILEYYPGGDLYERLSKVQRFDESSARDIMRELVEAVAYMHGQDIVHRDLKPENILLRSTSSTKGLVIADFGFATHCSGDNLVECLGTLSYMAPEVLSGRPYGKAVDVWALGAILYALLSGTFPFFYSDKIVMTQSIANADYSFDDDMDASTWSAISWDAKDLISKILVVDLKQRFSLFQILTHPWMRRFNNSFGLDDDRDDVMPVREIAWGR